MTTVYMAHQNSQIFNIARSKEHLGTPALLYRLGQKMGMKLIHIWIFLSRTVPLVQRFQNWLLEILWDKIIAHLLRLDRDVNACHTHHWKVHEKLLWARHRLNFILKKDVSTSLIVHMLETFSRGSKSLGRSILFPFFDPTYIYCFGYTATYKHIFVRL